MHLKYLEETVLYTVCDLTLFYIIALLFLIVVSSHAAIFLKVRKNAQSQILKLSKILDGIHLQNKCL